MFVVWVGSVLVTGLAVADPSVFSWLIAVWLWFTVLFANLAEAVAEGRGKAQADSLRRTRTETVARRLRAGRRRGAGARHRPEGRRPGRRRGGRGHPRRRRHRRGHRHRRRVGDHRRVRPGDPRVRRRPQLGHRRHDRAVRPDRRADHHRAGRVVRRPDDRAGRGRAAAEDAQRDRADDPAVRADDHLPARRRRAAADGRLLRRAAVAGGADRAAGLPDPDHDRRAAVGDRHRRAWTGSCSATCWRRPAGPSRPRATSTPCCWTRPARSPSATGGPPR